MIRIFKQIFRKKNLGLALVATLLCSTGEASAQGMNIRNGFGVDVTRVVIQEGTAQRAGSVVFTNNTRVDYIAKNRVVDYWTKSPVTAVLITPPLMLMPIGRQARVTVTVLRPDLLPTDRESLFLLESTAVPGNAKDGKSPANAIQLNIASALKVFYRPLGISADMTDAINSVTWTKKGELLQVENASPLHVSLAIVRANGKTISEGAVIKPFSFLSWDIGISSTGPVKVEWGGVNDYGALIRAKTQL